MSNIKKAITFVINTLEVGGAAKMLISVMDFCKESGYEVDVISLFDSHRNHRLSSDIQQHLLNCNVTNFCQKIRMLSKLRREIKKIGNDAVCAFVSDVCFYTRLSSIGLNIKLISAERGDPYTLPEKWKKRIKWTYLHSDKCVFQTNDGMTFFKETIQSKSVVIPNPYIPTGDDTPFEGERKKTIIGAGRLVPEKGFDWLIEAFSHIYDIHKDYRLIIYGEGPERQSLEAKINELGLNGIVELPGYTDHLQTAIREDGIFVLSSRLEGIPNSLMEAMAVGLPCVAMDCTPGGSSFLLGKSERGILIPVGDVDALSKAVCDLIEDKALRQKYSEEAAKIKETLKKDMIQSKWLSMFESIFEK